MTTAQMPDFDVYAFRKSSEASGEWITEIPLDDEACRSLKCAAGEIDENTIAVLRMNLSEGHVTDVSEDAAHEWLKDGDNWHSDFWPPVVEAHIEKPVAA